MDESKINQNTFVRYLLTIGFILLIFITLFLFLIVSRVVLSDTAPFSEHVKTTQNLLEDVDKVQQVVSQTPTNQTNSHFNTNNYIKFNFNEIIIQDSSYININENKSILTIIFNKELSKTSNNIYYFKIENLTTVQKGEIIVYDNTNPKIGEFLKIEDNKVTLSEKEMKIITTVDETEILGKVLLNQKND